MALWHPSISWQAIIAYRACAVEPLGEPSPWASALSILCHGVALLPVDLKAWRLWDQLEADKMDNPNECSKADLDFDNSAEIQLLFHWFAIQLERLRDWCPKVEVILKTDLGLKESTLRRLAWSAFCKLMRQRLECSRRSYKSPALQV